MRTVLLCCFALLAACGQQQPTPPPRQVPAGLLEAPAALAAGHELFLRLCASCHGRTEEGRSPRADFFTPPAPDFRADRFRQLDPAYLYWRIETGKSAEPYASQGSVMPAWGQTLSETQIWQLVAYLRSRSAN